MERLAPTYLLASGLVFGALAGCETGQTESASDASGSATTRPHHDDGPFVGIGAGIGVGVGTMFGASQQHLVFVTTEPKDAAVYIIPNTVWVEHGDEMLKNPAKLTPYARGEHDANGRVVARLMPYKYVAIMRLPSGGLSTPVEFVPQTPEYQLRLQ